MELRKVGNSSMLLASFCWSHICNKSCLFHAVTFYLFICGFYKNRKASLLRLHPRTVSNWSNPHLNLFSHLGYSNILLWNLCTVSRWWSGFLNTFFFPQQHFYIEFYLLVFKKWITQHGVCLPHYTVTETTSESCVSLLLKEHAATLCLSEIYKGTWKGKEVKICPGEHRIFVHTECPCVRLRTHPIFPQDLLSDC